MTIRDTNETGLAWADRMNDLAHARPDRANEPGNVVARSDRTNEPENAGLHERTQAAAPAQISADARSSGFASAAIHPDRTNEPGNVGLHERTQAAAAAGVARGPATRPINQPGTKSSYYTNDPEGRPDSAMLSSTLSTRMDGGGAIGLYQDMMIGSRSWLKLLQHEVLVSLGGALPGALGLAFRKLFWKSLFADCGGSAVFGRGVVLRQPLKMKLGARLLVDDDTLLDAKVAPVGGFVLGDDVLISRGCTIVAAEGPLRLGNRVSIGNGCTIMAGSGIEIGDDTLLAAHCYIGGGTYQVDGDLDVPMREQPGLAGRVVIGQGCWLGAGAVVISGVTIGKGAVVGAGALVNRDVPDYAVVAGVPATIRRLRKGAPTPGSAAGSPGWS